MRLRYSILIALISLLASQGHAGDAINTARATDDHYNHLQSLKSAFTEIYQAPGISRTESGVLWLKKPGRMRWEYRSPKEKLFLVDSQNAYFYVPGERQATKTSVKKIDDLRSPLRYLLGKAKLDKEFEGLSLAPDVAPLQPGNLVLRGVPRGLKDRISEVLLEISPAYQITRIVIQGSDSAITEFRFTQMEENVPVQDSFFRFTPPKGVTTIQEDQAAQ